MENSEEVKEPTVEELKDELAKAYRALRGIYGRVVNNQPVDPIVGYHSLTLGAAIRFVNEHSIEGTKYFIGKDVSVLQETLEGYKR